MDISSAFPDSPMEQDDSPYPCKGCGEILEEGKAFELAGNRWHIDCFRCNTCSTLLDSDANLLLLGDGSLICNNCTYSCSACGNKIEDLAILTGDQAFCASCFRCRNCKKRIENLKYARTSQGIFCMECHESLMQRRRKKTAKNSISRQKHASNNTMKSLPSLPPSAVVPDVFPADFETPPSEAYSDTPTELPHIAQKKPLTSRTETSRSTKRERSPVASEEDRKENLMLPSTTYKNNRHSTISQRSDLSGNGDFLIPMTLDPNLAPGPPPLTSQDFDMQGEPVKPHRVESKFVSRDYFNAKIANTTPQRPSQDYETPQISSGPTSQADSRPSSESISPHIAYQEKGRETSSDKLETIRRRKEQGLGSVSSGVATVDKTQEVLSGPRSDQNETNKDQFRLQEVPKWKKSGGSQRDSRSNSSTPVLDTAFATPKSSSAPVSATTDVKELLVTPPSSGSPKPSQSDMHINGSPHISKASVAQENGLSESPIQHPPPRSTQIQNIPQRGDSLAKITTKQQAATRKETTAIYTTKSAPENGLEQSSPASASTPSRNSPTAVVNMNGGRTISHPIESTPRSASASEIPPSPLRSRNRPAPVNSLVAESFVAPRVPPHPPTETQKERLDSTSRRQSDISHNGDQPVSPRLPRYSAGGDFTMDEDMARILGNEEHPDHSSFLRRVSHSVRHARSYSDRGTRLSKEHKWPKSPLNGTAGAPFGQEISPTSSLPDTREELTWFKNELLRERQKIVEKDQRIVELEAALDGKTSIKEMNTELREKRSTMVFLNSQKEIVIRELEVLTEHIAAAKKSGEPLDLGKMSNTVLRKFAESLQDLKDSYAPQIEDLIQKRNETVEEVANLTHLRDKSLQEFEQLSIKNSQLAELNNHLVHQIQGLYKASAGPSSDVGRAAPNGLGIYTHHQKEQSTTSMESRDLRPSVTESSMTGSASSTLVQENDAESATILTAPQVVNMRKGQPKRFNWKKGGHTVAKGVTKGLKGAFTSTDTNHRNQREGSFSESMPYASMPQDQEYPTNSLTKSNPHDPSRQGFGFFGNQKGKPGQQRSTPNASTSAVNAEGASVLFGSELEQRAEYEKVNIPGIVTRCIEEVELRGMDIEGIYRKSGGNSQIQHVKEGFERSNDFDISDPDLDISAVTSTLKQYFRRLPTPLITYPVYDKLLDSTSPHLDPESRIAIMHDAINDLPPRHRDVLEFLIFHLARVVEREKENWMTSLNMAVVFAPTVMRPESVVREMSEAQAKNGAVQFLIENCQGVFLGGE